MTQTIINLGTGGAVLNGRNGSTSGADSNDALFLDWTGENYVYLPGVNVNFMGVPDEAALDITGDIDIRAQVALDDWTPATQNTLVSKWAAQASFNFSLMQGSGPSASGSLRLTWVDSGSVTRTANTGFTLVPAVDGATLWVRVTLDVDDGAGSNVTTFYTSTDGVNWSTLSTVTQAFTTSIFSGNAIVRIGSRDGDFTAAGKFYRAQVFNGIDGTKVLDVDTSVIASGAATTFTALTGQTVTINRSTAGRKAVAVVSPVWLFGTDDYMEVADNDLLDFGAADSFTVVVVMRKWDTTTLQANIAKSTNYTTTGYMLFSSTNPTFRMRDTSTQLNAVSLGHTVGQLTVQTGVRSVALDTIQALRNTNAGTAVADTTTTSITNTQVLRVGGLSGGSSPSDMELLAVAVFRRVLSAAEISAITAYYQARLS